MSYQSERDEFLTLMRAEGVRVSVARALLRDASALQRVAELEGLSERADRDRVPCPTMGRPAATMPAVCLCMGYGSFDVAHSPPTLMQHGLVPRIAVKAWRLERRIRAYCAATTGTQPVPTFGGDPRGSVLRVTLPSRRRKSEGGVGVPAKGFTPAQMARICA